MTKTLPKVPDFSLMLWERTDDGQWRLYDGHDLVGEVYRKPSGWYYHCKTSDWRETCLRFETAKLRCIVSHVKEQMYKYALERLSNN